MLAGIGPLTGKVRALVKDRHRCREFIEFLRLVDYGLPGTGSGLVLLWKRLEHGAFRWLPISDGVMRLTASQLTALVDGMDWSRLHAHDVVRPTATS